MRIIKKINSMYDKYILKIAYEELPIKRCRVYTYEYFLKYFKLMLNDINNWRSLQHLKDYPLDSYYHYKYVNQVFNLWASKDIFKKAYIALLSETYFKLKSIKKSNYLTLFIDSTFIINKYGVDNVHFNPEYRKKNVSKLSIICDDNNNVLSSVPIKRKDKTFKSDITSVSKTINNLLINVPNSVNVNLIGDKGYVCNRKFKIGNKHVRIITRKKKGQTTCNSIPHELLTK